MDNSCRRADPFVERSQSTRINLVNERKTVSAQRIREAVTMPQEVGPSVTIRMVTEPGRAKLR